MKITVENYLEKYRDWHPLINADPALREAHAFYLKSTENGTDFEIYNESAKIKETIDEYFVKLSSKITGEKLPSASGAKQKAENRKSSVKAHKPKKRGKKTADLPKQPLSVSMIERLSEEIKFIRRFVNLDGKTKTKDELLRFINALQKAILEKKIRKTSAWADEIRFIQDMVINSYNTMRKTVTIQLKPETRERFASILGEEKVWPSISFIKRYIGLNGKSGVKEKAKTLLSQINAAIDKGRLSENDPYITEIHSMKNNLRNYIGTKGSNQLEIEHKELNGLEGILGCCSDSCNCNSAPEIMNSMDFSNLRFDTIGFTGKWLNLIGDPSRNFSAMVFGKPKMGKSFLCIDFAGYLARNHGKVLYVAKEEGLDLTLQDKLKGLKVAHPNLTISSFLPANLSAYDFIFIDSVSRLGLSPAELQSLRKKNPSKSFIFIFQTTKTGAFRGANTFQHDVDVVMEVPEKGKVVQMGRFNQGGEMDIFRVA